MSATAQQVMTAALALLNADLAPTAYDFDKVPAARPDEYVGVMVMRTAGGARRGNGTIGLRRYRLMVSAVSQESAANARLSLEVSRGALEFKCLSAGGSRSTPIQFETETAPGTKDGWSEGRQFFTFAI